MSWLCSVCEKSFSRKDNMQRHVMSKHRNAGLAHFKQFQYSHRNVSGFASSILSPPWLPEWSDSDKRTGLDLYCKKLQRPFIRRGSFGVIYKVSLRIHKCLSPCHTLNSSREFLRLLEQDSYFEVNKRNLIAFDDQMIDASKDKWIVNLFTRGSHHRNLSVIYIVQNIFHLGKGSRSISLNSHYLVLFKNPRDKLQILTLAKQMYPGQTDFFLNQYEEAVKRPFGHLLIILHSHQPL